MKSNIVKAQVEAGHKVVREDSLAGSKNSNIQDAASRNILPSGKTQSSPSASSPVFQNNLKTTPASNTFIPNALNEDNAASNHEELLIPANLAPAEEAAVSKVSSQPIITPRWLVPTGLMSNGPLGNDVALSLKAVKGSTEALLSSAGLPPCQQTAEVLASCTGEAQLAAVTSSFIEPLKQGKALVGRKWTAVMCYWKSVLFALLQVGHWKAQSLRMLQ
ncbi:band 4.1-like protein 5 isoform X2 [Meleagris gallopavo]|uniref:band 4.1-like protein 5 isoform X2 n=1 Tax=Meleagris gallopavo TaxID=9103 RepID=UPI00093DE971|nr:band 4.1-like protein 5 isoform X2 [Meleagris gallopavo]